MSRELEMTGTAVYGTVCAVVWEDGGREPSSYPIAPGMACGAIISAIPTVVVIVG